jgi:hypothetical protein
MLNQVLNPKSIKRFIQQTITVLSVLYRLSLTVKARHKMVVDDIQDI